LHLSARFFVYMRDQQNLLQEMFLRIHGKLDGIDDNQRITPWVFQIARNLVIDHYRSKSRVATDRADDLEARVDEEENFNKRVTGWIPEMISQLPDEYREAIELYELKGIPQQQIADQLGISLSGAKSRVQRGRAKLKSLLFDCCSFERDRRGNIIGYEQNRLEDRDELGNGCSC
jgi:RNA polymerase sigma-70 factor (ECF subfamily)